MIDHVCATYGFLKHFDTKIIGWQAYSRTSLLWKPAHPPQYVYNALYTCAVWLTLWTCWELHWKSIPVQNIQRTSALANKIHLLCMTCAIVLTYACLHYGVSKNHHIWICHLSCICLHDHYESPYIDMTCVLYMYARIPRGVVLTSVIVVYIHYHMTIQLHWPYMDIPSCIHDICLVYVCAYTLRSVFNIVYSCVHTLSHDYTTALTAYPAERL